MKKSEIRTIVSEEVEKFKIQQLIKEEVKILLTESTKSRVGILNPNGSISSVYVHSDGYLNGVGKMLQMYYKDTKKVKQLIALGDLSQLKKKINPLGKHDYNNPEIDTTIAFGRDRGEKDVDSIKSKDKNDYINDGHLDGAKYVYLWSPKEKKWMYSDLSSSKTYIPLS